MLAISDMSQIDRGIFIHAVGKRKCGNELLEAPKEALSLTIKNVIHYFTVKRFQLMEHIFLLISSYSKYRFKLLHNFLKAAEKKDFYLMTLTWQC